MQLTKMHLPFQDRISELPDDILFAYLSLLEIKNAAQTSILSRRWRYLWTHLTILDFDPKVMYPDEFATFWENHKYETRKYFAWINQVVRVHQGPSIDKFRVYSRYVSSYATQLDKWIQFALSKRVKVLVLDLIGIGLICVDYSRKGYPLGFDILSRSPCYSGISALQSLHLRYVNVSEEFLEFLLSHCIHLERLYLDSVPMSNFKVKTSKLKYLSIIMCFCDLEELEIDAENLLYFEYKDAKREGGPHMVFKSLPMLVETNFCGGFCRYPYPIFQQLSLFSMQLCKLSLDIEFDSIILGDSLVIPDGVIPNFPNVKHFTCTTSCFPCCCILSMKRFIEACPMLEEFKLQVLYMLDLNEASREASELQEIDLEDEKEKVETEIDLNLENESEHENALEMSQVENMNGNKQSHPNLRILEIVGFLGAECDVRFALDVVSYACSLKTIICDPQGARYAGTDPKFYSDALHECDVAKWRAQKLAQIVAPKVKVVTI